MGGLWIIQAAIPWTLVTTYASPRIGQALIDAGMQNIASVFAAAVCGAALPFALLLGLGVSSVAGL